MLKKIVIGIAIFMLVFLPFVNSRPDNFRYERSGVINASADKIYPYLNNFKMGHEWSPYEKIDPNMKKTFSGTPVGTGSVMEFAGNSEVGEGRLEIMKEVPNSLVEVRLEMTKPFHGVNTIEYKLTPEATGTRFTWSMHGEANFMSKLIGIFIDCEKMVGTQFEQGISTLKSVVESKKT